MCATIDSVMATNITKKVNSKVNPNQEPHIDLLRETLMATIKRLRDKARGGTGDSIATWNSSANDDENENNGVSPVYCICRNEFEENEFMIQCDLCQEWYHGSCINFGQKDNLHISGFDCFLCCGKRIPKLSKFWKPMQRGNRGDEKQRINTALKNQILLQKELIKS